MDVCDIRTLFVLPANCKSPSETYDEMQQAFESCKQNALNVEWIKENDKSVDFNKTDFVVFQTFEGEYFAYVAENFKSVRIVGPWCLLICLTLGRNIPSFPWPIYNIAMIDCVVTCSHVPKKNKQEIKEKIQSMGGIYTDTLVSKNTHLVTDTVLSEKYVQAAELGLKLMTPLWVETVWNRSRKANVHGNDEEFQSLRCPPFFNLSVCSTGIRTTTERKELQKTISDHGGTLTGALNVRTTNVLLCSGPGSTTSDKYKAARNSKSVACVSIEWVKDSIAKGYALPFSSYPVKKSTSTPTKGNEGADPDFSMMSVIAPMKTGERSVLQETANTSSMSRMGTPSGLKRKNSFGNEHNELVDGIDLKVVKRSGPFLDGCSVYIAGFGLEQRDKLCKILNFSGATRYDDISSRLTHVIVGDPTCNDLKIINSRENLHASVVTIQWLIESMERQHPVSEINYFVNQSAKSSYCNSPLSKKGLNLLRANSTIMEKELGQKENVNKAADTEIDSIQQYFGGINTETDDTLAKLMKNGSAAASNSRSNCTLKATTNNLASTPVSIRAQSSAKPPPETTATPSCTPDSEYTQSSDVFDGLKFVIAGFNEDESDKLKECIESVAGSVVSKSYRGIADYAVVPVFGSYLYLTATEIVNDLWVAECKFEGEIREVMYYHRPFPLSDSRPLEGCVVTISSYAGYERNFLTNLIQKLGGTFQEQFARVSCPGKNIVGSTHLLSLEASGKKYAAALRWKLPVVSKEWLLDCARTGNLMPEKHYLVGDAIAREGNDESFSSKIDELSNKPCIGDADSYKTAATPETTKPSQCKTPAFQRLQTEFGTPLSRRAVVENDTEHTPKNNVRTPDVCSQVTPVNKIMQKWRQNNQIESPLPRALTHVDTPETPLGAFIRADPSPNLRKDMARFLDTLPDWKPPPERRMSTPLAVLQKKLWEKICPTTPAQTSSDSGEEAREAAESEASNAAETRDETPENLELKEKLLQLEEMVNASGGKRRSSVRNFQEVLPSSVPVAESQKYTVEWDFAASQKSEETKEEKKIEKKIFMISGVDNDVRQEIVNQLTKLGAEVSDLPNYDPSCTHLVCPKPSRNEKTLACMAAGKWILHMSYVAESNKENKLLDEEPFEYGNPKASPNISIHFDEDTEMRMKAIHWWRKEITKRGYGAFHDMRAILVANKREMIIRVIEAGGGMVVEAKPPFDASVYATHCLLEAKSVQNFSDYITLAKQGVYCVNTVYISEYLHKTTKDIRDCILPYFSKFYSDHN